MDLKVATSSMPMLAFVLWVDKQAQVLNLERHDINDTNAWLQLYKNV